MKFLPLLWSQLWRNRMRTVLMALSIGTAFLLLGLIKAGLAGLTAGVRVSGSDRLVVTAMTGLSRPLPYTHRDVIAKVPGVTAVTPMVWFGGAYQDPRNSVLSFATDPRTFSTTDPTIVLPEDAWKAFATTRTAAIAGAELAARFGWKVGDKIPLVSPWPAADGSKTWEFDLVGLYTTAPTEGAEPLPATGFYFQYEYFATGPARGPVSWYSVRVADAASIGSASRQIDSAFLNSGEETFTQSERDFSTSALKQLGDIGSIGLSIMAATLFALVIAVGNSMMRTFRERVPELAVLKTLGFTNTKVGLLVLGEAILLCFTSAAVGIGLAAAIVPKARMALAQILPGLTLSPADIAFTLACAALLAAVSAALPVWRSARLTITQALSEA